MAQQGYGPPSLPVGTEVSAKYRGAFCEATVKSVVRVVKCKVVMKDCQSSVFVTDDEIKGVIKLSSVVEVKHPDTGQPVEGTINKLMDQSTYTVVFDDGDERTLRRSQLCLKGDKHFIESETLDNLPLSHPEHFGTPVLQNKKARRRNGDDSEEEEEDNDEDDSEGESPRRATYRGRHQELVGKLMLVETPQRKGSVMPALVVLPDANSLNEVRGRDQILLRSFKDSKFVIANRKELKEFSRSVAIKNEDKAMRIAYERALLFYDTKELPVGWKKLEMLGSDVEDDDDDNGEDEYASEDEPFEEKDRFVAQLYKFMDDRGTPINKGPCIGNKDLNLYKLFKIVQHLGGYNKVTKEMKWPVVYSKMGLPSLHQNPAHQIKTAYKKYLDAYETFFRKLGSTMGTLSRPGRARQNSGRNILSFRAREKSPRSPKPPEKNKDEAAENAKSKLAAAVALEKAEDPVDSSSVTSTEESDVITRRTPRREARVPSVREDSKERKDEATAKQKKEKKEEPATTTKGKKDEGSTSKVKKEEPTTGAKGKKPEVQKGKSEEEALKKEERKSARKAKAGEEAKEPAEKEDKKPGRVKKEKEEEKPEAVLDESVPPTETPKKRVTRRKLLTPEAAKEPAVKIEEDVKEPIKKAIIKDQKPLDKKEKEIPRTLERRDSRASDKKEMEKRDAALKTIEKKDPVSSEKKAKAPEEKKKKEKKVKEEADDGSDDNAGEKDDSEKIDPKVYYPIGSKLRVKYGKGKNQKIYIAKVVHHGKDAGHKTYRVHYAGWNSRYDEWIRPDRVVSVLDRPDTSKLVKSANLSKPIVGTSSAVKKLTTPPRSSGKTEEIFRTPKLISSKTRATRSSSTENLAGPSAKRIGGVRKRMTRRGSTVTDSAGSRSPESQMSSDAEENVESVEDDESTKDDKEDDAEDDLLDVDDEEKTRVEAELETQEKSGEDVIEEDENVARENSVSEPGSEKADDEDTEEDEERAEEKDKEWAKSEEIEDTSCSTSDEIVASVDDSKAGTLLKPESDTPTVVKAVAVTEVDCALDEIVSSVHEDREDVSLAEDRPEDIHQAPSDTKPDVTLINKEEAAAKLEPAEPVSAENLDSSDAPKEEIVPPEEKDKSDSASTKDDDKAQDLQTIPQLKKEVVDGGPADKAEDRPLSKPGRGKKKDAAAKDGPKKSIRTLDMSGTSMAASNTEIPMLEPMGPAVQHTDSLRQHKEPSPYDFEEEAEPSWRPEITKKWEPTTLSKASIPSAATPEQKGPKPAGLEAVGEEEKEKKKVKKKVKKKPISPEFVDEPKVEEPGLAAAEQPSQKSESSPPAAAAEETPISDADKGSEKVGLRKKGRKKKDVHSGASAKNDAMDQYESTVNSVVEAVKHALQGADSDQERRASVKRRRPKRVSESDSKDVAKSAKFMRKLGARNAPKASESESDIKPRRDGSCEPQEENTDSADVIMPVVSSTPLTKEEASASRKGAREPSLCESQGFEPQQESHGESGTFDNTPPTTPEHDEGNDNSPLKQDEEEGRGPSSSYSQHHPASSRADPTHHKDSTMAACASSSVTSSVTLSVSSTTNITSQTNKSSSESPSDNDVVSTASTDNLDSGPANQQSEGSGTDQDVQDSAPSEPPRKRKQPIDTPSPSISAVQPKKKKRVHGTRSRTARKSPKYTPGSDSQGSASNTPNHYPSESPPTKYMDFSKSPRPSKYNFSADLGEYLEGEARCSFLIAKMKEIKTIYMNLKSEVATIDRRRKRAKRKEKDGPQVSVEKDSVTT